MGLEEWLLHKVTYLSIAGWGGEVEGAFPEVETIGEGGRERLESY